MPLPTEKLMARLYRETRIPRRGWHPVRRLRAWWARPRRPRRPIGPRLRRWARRHWLALTVTGLMTVLWLFIYVHWYNKLYNLERDVDTAWAQVEAEQERRHHIQIDLIRLVVGHALHEQTVITDVTAQRTGATRAAVPPVAQPADHLDALPGEQLDQIFPRIMLMAEQYPTLRTSESFQQFAVALVDTENRVTDRIHAYNEQVNVYTTTIGQFPGNFFAVIYGFDDYDFYTPPPGTTTYRPVQYDPAAPTTGPAPAPPAAPEPTSP